MQLHKSVHKLFLQYRSSSSFDLFTNNQVYSNDKFDLWPVYSHSDSGPQGPLDYILKLNLSNSCLKALTSPSIKFRFFLYYY